MRELNIFPHIDFQGERKPISENLQIQTYGRRLTRDQTLSEYLIEFLLVYIGEYNGKTGLKKHISSDGLLRYKVEPNIALKRFIFLEHSKMDNRFNIDEKSNEKLKEILSEKIQSDSIPEEEILLLINELFHGFSTVTRERGWFAKALLPICKETIFCEAMGKKSKRENLKFVDDDGNINIKADTEFEFKEYNFQARGGEVYYLHLLQGFKVYEEKYGKDRTIILVNDIEKKINKIINAFPQFGKISKWIQSTWINHLQNYSNSTNIKEELTVTKNCQWIIRDYEKRALYTIQELDNLLSANTSEFEKFELLTIAIVFQLLRMMTEVASKIAESSENIHPMWLLHIQSEFSADSNIKKLATENYKKIEEYMMVAVAKFLENARYYKDRMSNQTKKLTDVSMLKKAYDDSHKLLRKLGKDIGLIIPIKGQNMRFTLSDKIVRFLVLSLVKPNSKMTLETFLEKLYEHFGIVIREKEYTTHMLKIKNKKIDASYLQYNLLEFQNVLRKNGFLKELSDATAIVYNPYYRLEV